MPRDVASLTPAEVLSLAIEIERRNAATYRILARVFHERRRDLGILFKELHEEELEHMDQLEALWAHRFGTRKKEAIAPEDVSELIEPAGPDPYNLAALRAATPAKAVAIAHDAEQGAANFYTCAAAQTKDAALKTLFTSLAVIEKMHVHQVAPEGRGGATGGPHGPPGRKRKC